MLAPRAAARLTTIEELLPPDLAGALDALDLHSRRVFAGRMQGERRSKQRGRGVEFEDYRTYVPGDDLRHIDWSVFARLDRMFIRVFQEEQDLSLHIVLDASASMDAGTPSKFVTAQRLAASLAYVGLLRNNRVTPWVIGGGEGPKSIGPSRGKRNMQRIAAFLCAQTPGGTQTGAATVGDFTAAIKTIVAARGGRGVMIVISDFLIPGEGYAPGLSLLAGAREGGYDVVLLQVLSPGELDPASELDGSGGRAVVGDLRLTDAETGRAAEVTVNAQVLKNYRARLDAYQAELHRFAARRGMTHVMIPSNADLRTLLARDLRRLGVVK
jgi:uncharacterized protein (DUF58 family)